MALGNRLRALLGGAEPATAVETLPRVAPRIAEAVQVRTMVARRRGPMRRMYAGARHDRLTADWIATNASADTEIASSLRALRFRSRQLVRDNDYARSMMRTIANNVVGHGVRMRVTVKQADGALDAKVNTRIEDLWREWCRPENCDVTGRLAFEELQRVVMTSVPESGEVLIRKVRGQRFGSSPVPFALELVEADQLADEHSGRAPNGNEIRMGVELNRWHRPVAYWLHTRHPGDYRFVAERRAADKLVRVPAEEIYHLFTTERPGQTRGVPWMHTMLRRMNNVGGIEEAETVAVRANAEMTGFIQSPEVTDPTDPEAAISGAAVADGVMDDQRVYDFEPGMIRELGPGETFSSWSPSRPNTNLQPFLRHMLQAACAGIGVSYESAVRDYSGGTYIAARLAKLDDRDLWRVLQHWYIRHFLQYVYEDFVEMAVLSGALDVSDYETSPARYRDVRWRPRGWDWLDPKTEVAASVMAVRAGFSTLQDIESAKGTGDYEARMEQRRAEIDMANSLDLTFDTNPAQTNASGGLQQTLDESAADDARRDGPPKPA